MLARIRAARENESGFTLIELLIVIVILGVLSGIVVFSVSGITGRSQAAACKTDLATVQTASEAYNAANKVPLAGGGYAISSAVLATAYLQGGTMPATVVYTGNATGAVPTVVNSASCLATITANP
jgi:prepilin-type N-terminal cleavage/methylation domain-containing protein